MRRAIEREELRALREIAFSDERAGARLGSASYACIRTATTRARLDQSDEIVDELDGSRRLRERRRRGILRHVSGPDYGFPFFRPSLDRYRTSESPDPRIFKFPDELEWVVIPGRIDEDGEWRPTKDELTFDEARAIAGMKASTLYAHTSARDVPGQIVRTLGDDLDRATHHVRFKTEEFMKWAEVVKNLSIRKK